MVSVIGCLGGALGGFGFYLAVRGLIPLFKRQWRTAFPRLLAFVGIEIIAVFIVPAVSLVWVNRYFDDPADKARILAEMISAVFNWGAALLPIAVGAGLYFELRAPRQSPGG